MTGTAPDGGNKRRVTVAALLFLTTEGILLFAVPRADFYSTYGLFLFLFALYFYLLRCQGPMNMSFFIGLAVAIRILAIFNIPELSDDFYRFIWDGKMSALHINPFRLTPAAFMQHHRASADLQTLYSKMNSPDYHTIYPPVLQYIFYLAARLSGTSITGAVYIMKLFIVAAELVTIKFILRLLHLKQMRPQYSLLYLLNPLIVVELTGNLHFEAFMICFLVCSFYYLHKESYFAAAVCWGLAIASKLTPLIIAPLLLRFLGVRKFAFGGTVAALLVVALFLPFYGPGFFEGFNASARLFYHLFEFNASIFYAIRSAGYLFVDYDIIEETAPVLGVISLVVILLVSWWPSTKFSIENKTLWVFFTYFLFSTMVHPWYISILLMCGIFTRYRFPVLFTLLIPMSYFPYSLQVYNENLFVVLGEYLLVFGYLLWEIRRKGRPHPSGWFAGSLVNTEADDA
jgi:alpha-1,6-mannosyltransferase